MIKAFKVLYKYKGALTSWPFVLRAGIGVAYKPEEYYQMTVGPFMAYLSLDSAVQDMTAFHPKFRGNLSIWQVEGKKWHLDQIEVPYGIKSENLTKERAEKFWNTVTAANTNEERYQYLASLGGKITKGDQCWFNPKFEKEKNSGAMAVWEYGTLFLETIKLVKEIKPSKIAL